MSGLKVDGPMFAAVRFPWIGPISAEEWLERLRKAGLEAKIIGDDGDGFGIEMRHATWGTAQLMAMHGAPPVDDYYFVFASNLSPKVRKRLLDGGYDITVMMQPRSGDILRDKKALFRFARAVMGDDALAMIDTFSTRVWLAGDLDMELMHDADLDIESLYAIHGVATDDEKDVDEEGNLNCTWLHTHGLAELGGFDIDIMRPHASFVGQCTDCIRAMAFAILDGDITPDTAEFPMYFPDGVVAFVPVAEFVRGGDPKIVAIRDAEGHDQNRSVLCEPNTSKKMLTFGKKKQIEPAKCLQRQMPEEMMSPFTNRATELMARRARATLQLLASVPNELADLQPRVIAKLGCLTDEARAASSDDREHMWFEVHQVRADTIDATLMSSPFDIAGMKAGDRAWHDLESLSDWMINTPLGNIDPRDMSTLQMIRAMPKAERVKIVKALAEGEGS